MLRAEHNGYEFVIEQDKPEVGVYMYVFIEGQCVRDELQNDLGTCIRIALEDYGVPTVAWSEDGKSSIE